jgi:hypothetical protein
MQSPFEGAYQHAVYNRMLAMVYSALDYGASPEDYRMRFRKEWSKRGVYQLAELLLLCARPDWSEFPETFWMNPWIAKHLSVYDAASLCHFVELWLKDEPLPYLVSTDPLDEDRKVKDLERLHSALNRSNVRL